MKPNQEIYQFGSYAGIPVEWLVLRKDTEQMLLLSRYILDAKVFFPDCIYTGWARSSVRTWLNDEFYQTAFTPDEQRRILNTSLFTPDCPGFENYAENHTQDKLFLLSEQELSEILPNPNERTAPAEPHAVSDSPDLRDFMNLLPFYRETQNCWWWLRSPGIEPNMMGVVWADGTAAHFGHYVNYERGIRPAMYVRRNA